MGLNYGFDIFCDRSKVWEFIDSIIELDYQRTGPAPTLTLIFGGQQKVVPWWLSYERNTLSLDDPENDDGICLSLPFPVDEAMQDYLTEHQETMLKQNPQYEPREPDYDGHGRVYLGCIYLYIVTNLDAIGRTGYDKI